MASSLQDVKKIYGLLGYPLIHSFSKDFFNHKFELEDINAEYLNFELEDIGDLMEVIAQYPHLMGLNVTSPYKEQVLPYLNEVDAHARAIGAVNVIKIVRDSRNGDIFLKGFNSDTIGFRKSIEPLLAEIKHPQAMILGTGGASKAVSHAFEQLGVEVMIVSRKKTAATFTYEELTKAMVHAHPIVVNATPLGTYPNTESCPNFPYRFLSKEHLAYDLVYNPEETLFMKNAKAHGATIKNGLEMLLLQGFAAYDIWTTPEK